MDEQTKTTCNELQLFASVYNNLQQPTMTSKYPHELKSGTEEQCIPDYDLPKVRIVFHIMVIVLQFHFYILC